MQLLLTLSEAAQEAATTDNMLDLRTLSPESCSQHPLHGSSFSC